MRRLGLLMTRRYLLWVTFAVTLPLLYSCAHLQRKPDVIEIAQAQIGRGDVEGAFNTLEEAMRKDPSSLPIGNFYRAQIVAHDKEDRSIAFFKKLAETPQAPDEVYYNLAFAYIDKIPRVGPMGAGFLSKRSIAQFKSVYERRPEDWIANYGIGMNYLHWPDYFKKPKGHWGTSEVHATAAGPAGAAPVSAHLPAYGRCPRARQ